MADEESVPFSSHLDELRKRLMWSLLGIFVVFSLVFALWAGDIVNYIQQIAVLEREVDGEVVQEPIRFAVIATLEPFSVTMRVSLYAALVFAYPWVMLQAYLFVAPGLYRHERRFFQFAIPSIFVLFAAGAAFGRYILLPISMPFLLGFNVDKFDVETHYSLAQFLSLVFTLTFGLGFVFQIPLVVAPLIRFGLLTPEFFRKKRRYTILISVVIGAVISPTGSPIDMVLAGAPVLFLVEGGVLLGAAWKKLALRRAEKEALEAAARGEKIDPEALAGGLAIDLEKRLKEFSKGGARELARELMSGFNESGKDIESIFDDDYSDDEKPPVAVKLKQKPSGNGALMPDQMHDAKFEQETNTGSPASAPESAAPGASEAAPQPAPTEPPVDAQPAPEEHPDRPWDENVDENTARYIDDRISQRLRQYFEAELRPWMDRIEHELRNRNGNHE
ncbi:MAG: twin-arginine translocase subunit TatC [Planctomycetes bacterium]|nr:twin-arginine translocase subunit TatC [Planctomycetota bacterium]MCW8135204.1 twin-arginine translocase subunit TatC [Planctomycetota bacterium]